MECINNLFGSTFHYSHSNIKKKLNDLVGKVEDLIISYGIFISLGAILGGAITSVVFSTAIPLIAASAVVCCALQIFFKLKNKVTEIKNVKSNESTIKSISNMNQNEINGFATAQQWVQERGLFKQHMEDQGFFYWGSYTYDEALDSRIKAKTRLFKDTIEQLNENDIYLDVGAGDGNAIMEYRRVYPNGARVIGVSLHQPSSKKMDQIKKLDERDKKFTYYLCDFFNFPISRLNGKVSVITDVVSAFRYGRNPTQFMQKAGQLLKEGGIVFIKFTIADGIKVPSEYNNLCCTESYESTYLLRYWFHTIRGFDVIQADMDLNQSKVHQKKIISDIREVLSVDNFDRHTMVLRRNSDPVEVDTLIISPDVDAECPKGRKGKNWDYWAPKYTWVMSEYSKSMLQNPKKMVFI